MVFSTINHPFGGDPHNLWKPPYGRVMKVAQFSFLPVEEDQVGGDLLLLGRSPGASVGPLRSRRDVGWVIFVVLGSFHDALHMDHY